MNSHRLIVLLYVVLLAGLGIGAGRIFFEAQAQYAQLKQVQRDFTRRLDAAQKRLAQQEKTLERLRTDPAFVEKVMRKQNYANPNEVIFLFETFED